MLYTPPPHIPAGPAVKIAPRFERGRLARHGGTATSGALPNRALCPRSQGAPHTPPDTPHHPLCLGRCACPHWPFRTPQRWHDRCASSSSRTSTRRITATRFIRSPPVACRWLRPVSPRVHGAPVASIKAATYVAAICGGHVWRPCNVACRATRMFPCTNSRHAHGGWQGSMESYVC